MQSLFGIVNRPPFSHRAMASLLGMLLPVFLLPWSPCIARETTLKSDSVPRVVPNDELDIPCDWKVGFKARVELTREKQQFRGGQQASAGKSRTPIDVEVIQKTENGYVIRWTFGRPEVLGGKPTDNPMVERMLTLTEGLRLDIETDEQATPVGLKNTAQVVEFYKKVVETLMQGLKTEGVPAATVEQVRKSVEPLTDPKSVAVTAIRDATVFFMVCGGSFELGNPVEYEDQLPNVFGGEPFPAKATFLLKDVSAPKREAVIEWKQTPDPVKAAALIDQALKQMIKRSETKSDPGIREAKLSIDDSARFVIDTETGWPRSVTHERRVTLGDGVRVDRLIFQTLPR